MASFVKSVERITANIPAALGSISETVNLTKNQDWTKCVPVGITAELETASGNYRFNNIFSAASFDNSGTAAIEVRHRPPIGENPSTVDVQVLEFNDNVNVQSGGPLTFAAESVSQAISAVNPDNALIFFSVVGATNNATSNYSYVLARSKFTANNEITFYRYNTAAAPLELYWFVAEGNGADFQVEHVEIAVPDRSKGPGNYTLANAVNLDHAFIVPSYSVPNVTNTAIRDNVINLALTDVNTLTWYRDHPNALLGAPVINVAVVRSDAAGFATQRFVTDVSAGSSPVDQAIASVDLDKALILSGMHNALGDWPINSTTSSSALRDRQHRIYLTSPTNLRHSRRNPNTFTGGGNVRNEIVEFELGVSSGIVVAPAPAVANSSSIAPDTVLSSILLAPAEAASGAAAIDPIVVIGDADVVITPAFAEAAAGAIDPDTVLSSIALTVDFAEAAASAIDPSVELSSLILTPEFAESLSGAIDPVVVLSAIVVPPEFAAVDAAAIDPEVVITFVPITPVHAEADVEAIIGAVVLSGAIIEPDSAALICEASIEAIFPQLWSSQRPTDSTWTPEDGAADGWSSQEPLGGNWSGETPLGGSWTPEDPVE